MSGKRRKTVAKKKITKTYEPTLRERDVLAAYLARRDELPPRLRVSQINGVPKLKPVHPNESVGYTLLTDALAIEDDDFLNGLLKQLANAASQGPNVDEAGLNFMLSMIRGVEPRDQVETMLAAQMAAVHMATMTFARRLAHVDDIPQQDSAERAFNKLARTFASQVEALKRYRTGGRQTVTVEHVTVNAGGQAIVGNVETGGRGVSKKHEPTP